ncbi:MAG: hypothetical protein KVP17_004789 [Porospora cf. gigantea B]|uniref:uncharacterized protein n=1 Tax=Porospora cf. gigantea B TaxID=2853592 RepID=UPI003571CE92|nr:MAG: hypothetical protein KVP17_004789 [Porospora cf. gigantea B]
MVSADWAIHTRLIRAVLLAEETKQEDLATRSGDGFSDLGASGDILGSTYFADCLADEEDNADLFSESNGGLFFPATSSAPEIQQETFYLDEVALEFSRTQLKDYETPDNSPLRLLVRSAEDASAEVRSTKDAEDLIAFVETEEAKLPALADDSETAPLVYSRSVPTPSQSSVPHIATAAFLFCAFMVIIST